MDGRKMKSSGISDGDTMTLNIVKAENNQTIRKDIKLRQFCEYKCFDSFCFVLELLLYYTIRWH